MSQLKTAGIIVIGNEILSGKVKDINSYYLACELRSLGIDVRRISVIPDDIKTIGGEIFRFSGKYNYVFTSGGVGPTHDDVTMAAVADGFGVSLVSNKKIREILLSRYRRKPNSAVLKMTEVPEGSEIIFSENMRFPVIAFKNVFIFPGIPDYVKNKFSAIKERFRSSSFYLKRIFLVSHETEITETLNQVVADNQDVMFGSYPALGEEDYRIIITAESKSEAHLNSAVDKLLKLLPEETIVRIE